MLRGLVFCGLDLSSYKTRKQASKVIRLWNVMILVTAVEEYYFSPERTAKPVLS